ncbi:S8 family serine peptidase [Nocardioides albidus]|uniref:S8 family serine peptidase n=1 Tax=Nocardioides albidus TaxID=1517589 RepID=UPI0013052612|nr:S8 family serine peptidase [Nocardioides albidus]
MTLAAEEIWKEHTRGEGVVVAVIDSGVIPTGDLEGAVLPGFSYDGSGRGDTTTDPDFHGTSMATLIAGRGTGDGVLGIAPEATILPVRLPRGPNDDDTTQALRTLAAMDDPPEVVNMSIDSGGGECSSDMQEAVRAAVDKGMILVASMGNDHSSIDYPQSPASCPGVLGVGAFGWNNFGFRPDDAPDLRIWSKSEHQPYAAFAAPGVHVITFLPGRDEPFYVDGTSDSAAIASGSIALVRAAYPDMPSRELVARLIASAKHLDLPAGTRDPAWGFGVLRPRSAIEDTIPTDAPNPIYDELDEVAPPSATPGAPAGNGLDDPGAVSGSAGAVDREALVLAGFAGGLVLLGLVAAGVVLLVRRRG